MCSFGTRRDVFVAKITYTILGVFRQRHKYVYVIGKFAIIDHAFWVERRADGHASRKIVTQTTRRTSYGNDHTAHVATDGFLIHNTLVTVSSFPPSSVLPVVKTSTVSWRTKLCAFGFTVRQYYVHDTPTVTNNTRYGKKDRNKTSRRNVKRSSAWYATVQGTSVRTWSRLLETKFTGESSSRGKLKYNPENIRQL